METPISTRIRFSVEMSSFAVKHESKKKKHSHHNDDDQEDLNKILTTVKNSTEIVKVYNYKSRIIINDTDV